MESPKNEGEQLPVEGTSDLSAGLGVRRFWLVLWMPVSLLFVVIFGAYDGVFDAVDDWCWKVKQIWNGGNVA